MTRLAEYTTLGLGGPARSFVTVTTNDELTAAVRAADAAGEPALILGGGSNLVVADEGFPGTAIHVATRGVSMEVADGSACEDTGVMVTAAAGENWDDVVAATVSEGLAGLECLSGIPGRVGATPIQNVGAYGQEVAEAITTVRVLDRLKGSTRIFLNGQCGFSYRTSLFKTSEARYVVLDVTFRLHDEKLSRPVRYAELAAALNVATGERVGIDEARCAVLEIRARKGMVITPGDPDTRSAGSFFTNPVLTAERFAEVEAAARARGLGEVPHFAVTEGAVSEGAVSGSAVSGSAVSGSAAEGRVKVPAAWLIERSGFPKGHGDPAGARVSSKHTLALVNAGAATTDSLLALAREIRAGVRQSFGVTLDPEPILVGVTL